MEPQSSKKLRLDFYISFAISDLCVLLQPSPPRCSAANVAKAVAAMAAAVTPPPPRQYCTERVAASSGGVLAFTTYYYNFAQCGHV